MAEYGICNLSVVPCREEPSDKSQMVTQLLFGECFEVLSRKKQWCNIRNACDGYESWIDSKQFAQLEEEAYLSLNRPQVVCATDLLQLIKQEETGALIPIVAGSSLPDYADGSFSLGGQRFEFKGRSTEHFDANRSQALLDLAMVYRNAPYLWGGRSPFGIDCSGLIQVLYKMIGIRLQRDANQQAEQGQTLSFVEEADIGDLAFFDNDEGDIIHVGMMIGPNAIMHASGKVRIDKLDHQGIFNVDTAKYSHKLRLIRRVLE